MIIVGFPFYFPFLKSKMDYMRGREPVLKLTSLFPHFPKFKSVSMLKKIFVNIYYYLIKNNIIKGKREIYIIILHIIEKYKEIETYTLQESWGNKGTDTTLCNPCNKGKNKQFLVKKDEK